MANSLCIGLGVFLILYSLDNILFHHNNNDMKFSIINNFKNDKSLVPSTRMPFSEEIIVNRNICETKFLMRRFKALIKRNETSSPSLLYSFPGSGNTWTRLLIDYSTGVYSGSMYHDRALFDILPGERHCNHKVSTIKAHPHLQTFNILSHGNLYPKKCTNGNIHSFQRAILLIRDPFDSIFSEFQRRWSGSHIGGILKSSFNKQKWNSHCGFLSLKYKEMLNIEYNGIISSFGEKNILIIFYEELKNIRLRIEVLKRIVEFLKPDLLDSSDSIEQARFNAIMDHRIKCAFLLAETRNIRRETLDRTDIVQKDDVYTQVTVCKMWSVFGQAVTQFGLPYRIYKNYSCDHHVS